MLLDPDRLFPSDPAGRTIARDIYASTKALRILSPHGHVDPGWFSENQPFADASELLIIPDHYVLRMLVSQGISLDDLGVGRTDGTIGEPDRRAIWRRFCRTLPPVPRDALTPMAGSGVSGSVRPY